MADVDDVLAGVEGLHEVVVWKVGAASPNRLDELDKLFAVVAAFEAVGKPCSLRLGQSENLRYRFIELVALKP
ncbi:MAG: hypothetical protein ACJ78Q_01460 [Chloroflexia bacterium]